MTALSARLMAEYPSSYSGPLRLSVTTLDQEVVSDVKPALAALSGAVGFVLLVAVRESRESAPGPRVRTQPRGRGASVDWRIARTDRCATRRGRHSRSVCSARLEDFCWRAGASKACCSWRRRRYRGAKSSVSTALPRCSRSLRRWLAQSLASVVPVWQATRTNAVASLKKDPGSSRGAATVRGLLSAGQLALSLVLLVGAGLMGRAFVSLRSVPLGFESERALTMSISLQGQRFNRGTLAEARVARLAFYRQLTDAVRQIPGVEQAGVGFPIPLKGITMVQRFATNLSDPERQAEAVITFGGYLETLGVSIVAGRPLTRADETQPVVIVDERLARRGVAESDRLSVSGWRCSPTSRRLAGQKSSVSPHMRRSQGLRSAGLPQIWMTYELKSYSGLDLSCAARTPRRSPPR